MNDPERYADKPFRLLLECYILLAIDQLSEERVENLNAMQPHLVGIYGHNLPWNEIVDRVMDFPENMPETIREMWARNTAIAVRHDIILHPQQFAEMFVDQNLDE